MLDETIITETPPLYCCYGRRGQQTRVWITGNRAKRILHGVLNIQTGTVLLFISEFWEEQTHQFEDQGSPHTADDTIEYAAELQLELRFLPTATPKLNAMDHLWRHVKGRALADQPTFSIDRSADLACEYIYQMTPQQRLKQAGVLSGNFWLTT